MDKDKLEEITGIFCEKYCKYQEKFTSQSDLDDICESCPMNELAEFLE